MATDRPFIPVRIAVMTVSDSRALADDRSGQTLVDRIAEAGHILADRAIVTDDKDKIRERLGFSPDMGDAAALTFAVPLAMSDADDDYREPARAGNGSGW